MIKKFRCSNRENKCRILVPVKEAWCIDELTLWLAENPQHQRAQVEMVHVIEPKWFYDIPYSAPEANRLIDEQEQISAQRQREFMFLASRLTRHYRELALSVRVVEGRLESQTIIDLAEELEPDFILMFCRTKGTIRQFFGANRLSREVMQSAKCPVHIIQLPRTRNAQSLTTITARSSFLGPSV